jgi:hypothetical protein
MLPISPALLGLTQHAMTKPCMCVPLCQTTILFACKYQAHRNADRGAFHTQKQDHQEKDIYFQLM